LLELTLIDQVVYCGVIRPKLVGIALERGLSQWALSDQETREFEKIAQDELDQWLDQHPHFHPGWRISLSWNRLFEARLTR
jgi:hypothetical protein